MTKKNFAVSEGSKSEPLQQEPAMTKEQVHPYFKGDGYDELRAKVWQEGITESQFIDGVTRVEASISKMHERNNREIVYPTFFKEPLEDRVIILADEAAVMTAGGLYIPDQLQNTPARGTVVAVGPGKPDKQIFELTGYTVNDQDGDPVFYSKDDVQEIDPKATPVYKLSAMPLRVGNKVLYGKQAGLTVEDPTTKIKYLIMRVSDCFIKL